MNSFLPISNLIQVPTGNNLNTDNQSNDNHSQITQLTNKAIKQTQVSIENRNSAFVSFNRNSYQQSTSLQLRTLTHISIDSESSDNKSNKCMPDIQKCFMSLNLTDLSSDILPDKYKNELRNILHIIIKQTSNTINSEMQQTSDVRYKNALIFGLTFQGKQIIQQFVELKTAEICNLKNVDPTRLKMAYRDAAIEIIDSTLNKGSLKSLKPLFYTIVKSALPT